jgi:hypothetical protein
MAGGLAMLVPAAVALAASGTFTGTTSQGKACGDQFNSECTVRVVVANGSIQKQDTGHSHIFWAADCSAGKNEVLANETDFWGRLQHGNLRVKHTYTQYPIPGQGGPYKAKNSVNLYVHVGSRVTGTFSDSTVVYKGAKTINHCHTGTVSFTARR